MDLTIHYRYFSRPCLSVALWICVNTITNHITKIPKLRVKNSRNLTNKATTAKSLDGRNPSEPSTMGLEKLLEKHWTFIYTILAEIIIEIIEDLLNTLQNKIQLWNKCWRSWNQKLLQETKRESRIRSLKLWHTIYKLLSRRKHITHQQQQLNFHHFIYQLWCELRAGIFLASCWITWTGIWWNLCSTREWPKTEQPYKI